MKTAALTLATLGFLSGTVSAIPFFSNLMERQAQDICPQVPPVKDERIPIADVHKAVENLPLNGTGANLGQNPVAEKPQVKTETAYNFEKLRAFAPNNTAMFQYQAVVNRLAHPWNTIGKVWVHSPGGITQCTGTLVARNILLTADHCLSRNYYYIEFAPAFDGTSTTNPRPFGTAYSSNCMTIVHPTPATPNGLDYKVCRLTTNIGDRTGTMGYLGWTTDAPYKAPEVWTSVGYPMAYRGGQVPVVQQAIRIDDVDDQSDGTRSYCGKQLEEYSVYATAGWDGAPMFKVYPGGGAAIAGVVSRNEFERIDWDLPTNTMHAGGVCMLELIVYAISIWT